MLCYGQVIETYCYDNQPWLTIWDLAEEEQIAVIDRAHPPLKIGQLVSFVRKGRQISDVQKIGKMHLPKHLKPIM